MIRNIVALICTAAMLVIAGYFAILMIVTTADPLAWLTLIQHLLVLGPVVVVLGMVLFLSRIAEATMPAMKASNLPDGVQVVFTVARVAGSVAAAVVFVIAGSFTVLFAAPVLDQQVRMPIALLVGVVLLTLLLVQELIFGVKRSRLKASGTLLAVNSRRTPRLVGLLLTAATCMTVIGTVVMFVHVI